VLTRELYSQSFLNFLGGGIQGFTLARQVFYHLSYASSSFCSGYFGDTSLFLPRPAWSVTPPPHFSLPSVAGMTGTYYHTQLFSIEMGSYKLFCLSFPGTAILLISASLVA
jgi:hypothetical protein